MQWPIESDGESNAQPNTPCSASTECGGNRSTRVESANAGARRGAFFKSTGAGPDGMAGESITSSANRIHGGQATPGCLPLIHGLSRGCAQELKTLTRPRSRGATLSPEWEQGLGVRAFFSGSSRPYRSCTSMNHTEKSVQRSTSTHSFRCHRDGPAVRLGRTNPHCT